MSDLVLSNLTINGRPIGVFDVQPDPPAPLFPSVQIGNQIWMSENLHIDDGGEGIVVIDSVMCNGYDLGPQTYYNWAAAVRVANSIDGWHLPSTVEWEELYNYMDSDGNDARSVYAWSGPQGTNSLGLNVLPVGRGEYPYLDNIQARGDEANFWTSNDLSSNEAGAIFFYPGYIGNWGYGWYKLNANSVRLIKD